MAINHVLSLGAAALMFAAGDGGAAASGTPPPLAAPQWLDAPLPDGDWTWRALANGSAAWFGPRGAPARAALVCDRSAMVVDVVVTGDTAGARDTAQRPATIATSTGSATLVAAAWRGEGVAGMAIAVPAQHRILDAMAFSRGRFRVEIVGFAPIVLPSWSEVGRVVEDCRG